MRGKLSKMRARLRLVVWEAKSAAEAEAELKLRLPAEMQNLVGDPKVRFIPLTQNQFAAVDADQYAMVSQFNWHTEISKRTHYARRNVHCDGAYKAVFMHSFIFGRKVKMLDHINGCGIDNRRCNLREASAVQNVRNCCARINKASVYKGVHFRKNRNTWQAAIRFGGKRIYLGNFHDEKQAAMAYLSAEKRLFGEFFRSREIA